VKFKNGELHIATLASQMENNRNREDPQCIAQVLTLDKVNMTDYEFIDFYNIKVK